MREKEKVVATGLVLLMLILLFGFIVHVSQSFAGSFWGGVLGVSGSLLMFVPLLYMAVKRIKWLKTRVTKRVSMKTLLAWHIYAGIVGPILVVLHSGHKFESALGISLMTLTMIVVLSGFVGRYLMAQFSTEIREKKAMLASLQAAYSRARTDLAQNPAQASLVRSFSGIASRLIGRFLLADETATASQTTPSMLLRITDSIADVEYAIAMHEQFKLWFRKWLKLHIVLSFVLYGLLLLHVWAGIHFGLRWFDSWTPTTLNRGPVIMTSPEKAEEFSTYFGRAFQKYWRPRTRVNGIETTVFDYSAMAAAAKRPTSNFSRAVVALRQTDPFRFKTANDAKAFWLNVYNFGAMRIAADNFPINSITDRKVSLISNPWGLNAIDVGGRGYSLREVEKNVLLPKFEDPRIVFAVSCAAVSCPDRSDKIFSGKDLDAQLDAMVRGLFTNPDKGLRLDRENKTLTLSWIIKADRKLFGNGEKEGILQFVERYAPDDVVDWLRQNQNDVKLEYFKHDWTLNDSAQAN